jgi:hypothetical protein
MPAVVRWSLIVAAAGGCASQLPIYELSCDGKPVFREAIRCRKGDCYTEQMAGRCWK